MSIDDATPEDWDKVTRKLKEDSGTLQNIVNIFG